MRGKCLWFSARRGFGFIMGEDEVERFFHFSHIVDEHDFKFMYAGDAVEFDTSTTSKGEQAVNVRRLSVSQEVRNESA